MTFAARITRTPRPFNRDRADETLAPLRDLPPELHALLHGTAGCSPYLRGLITREAEWLRAALSVDPETAFDDLLDWVRALADGDLKTGLRQGKRRAALLIALADLGGVWPLDDVTDALSRFADLATDRALRACIGAQHARGKLPGVTDTDLAVAGGLCALAMGKMGAHELNYSSDIDLICLIDDSRFDPHTFMEARPGFVRATRAMATLLSDVTGDGYVFRTDLRLRPDPSVTPVALSMEAAERYYESLGRTWERAAHIKARPCAGDVAAGARYLEHLRPFIWRRHLDFAAIQDAHDMRLRIRDHKGLGGAIILEGHDMKLGRGGIREIEFFTQTRQIIAGGRDPSLRVRGTLEGLNRLVAAGWVDQDVADTLGDDYRAHREVEHRLQMIADQQTHELPQTDDGFARLAAMMDRDVSDLRADLTERLDRVHEISERFFAPNPCDTADTPDLSLDQQDIVKRWRSYPALRSARAQEIFGRLRPDLLRRLAKSAAPDQALLHFDGFLKGLPAGVQLFALFEANPQLIDLVVDIVATSPDLAAYLARNAQVLDSVLGGGFFEPWPDQDGLEADITAQLAGITDYESILDRLRAWAKEWRFRIGVHHLRNLITAEEAGTQYADLAGAVVSVIWPRVVAQFAVKHGAPPGRGAMVLGMGSLGARRLNSGSDLDLIMIYDADGAEESDGPRPLGTRPYFARLTQALVTALSAPMAEGRLYEVDMRLRPSGRQGPVATSLRAFQAYQRTEAWTWEHLALTRARPIAGDDSLCADVESLRREILDRAHDRAAVCADVADMRARLAAARSPDGPLDARAGPGRLQDIELVASCCALLAGAPMAGVGAQLQAGQTAGLLSAQQCETLTRAQAQLWALHVASRLLLPGALVPERLGAGGIALVLRDTGCGDLDELIAHLSQVTGEAAKCVADMLGNRDAAP
ncbi:bifunctional [glutamate--ammonia ligase]-adenylyl-L-tyrosine phosphorylase/[glutamate--ammonia-ligase] adenylyltransferase [Oceaniglobus ichthyenteri]|uniref:bifunctional [glutamate--ammonia ligase]-adenylyl-L-tyrosine phosphorylase/[glutamate--ammonia-ligase] adenylyltransferase n=1 Tax=Oceaniglobus ichthyenteri TaxID=2136177 RepID=UPI000D397807|nr:bifunctional [glutamate--ammonia ligase]-adenylyl-L-tyrosine phosphorylase/[glutamate--ammonia-ligase] adenylyltransferase [Oceaniglobus ichthyenteri]